MSPSPAGRPTPAHWRSTGATRARPLSRRFFARDTLHVAQALLGKVLVHDAATGTASGLIVEVEAYIGEDDPACHAACGPTERNRPLYGRPGFAYVYLNYGVHHLVNAVTEAEGHPAAVLIRALEPLEGISLMAARRGMPGESGAVLTRGPGRLSRALGITLVQNEVDLTASPLRIEDRGFVPRRVSWSTRVGIRVGTDRRWRCFVVDAPGVSPWRAGQAKRRSATPRRGASSSAGPGL
ncbi:MAG: DNA-3-methyladenine glycosylase [Vicinamibacterales bacterium]